MEGHTMSKLHVERVGGLAGIGGTGAHVRSRGEIDMTTLSAEEQRILESLFRSPGSTKHSQVYDGFRYRISRTTVRGIESIEVPEAEAPTVLSRCVKDELT